MNIKEIRTLNLLLSKDRTTPLKSASIQGILKSIEGTKHDMSESTLRKYIVRLVDGGYIAFGIKDEQKKKYYITQKGIDLISDMTGGMLDE